MKFKHLPVNKPVVVTSAFGGREAPIDGASNDHKGVDLRSKYGSAVYAVNYGKVIRSGNLNNLCGWGVIIDHGGGPGGWKTGYCHLAEGTTIKEGFIVSPGQRIAYVGTTGTSTSPHLHFTLKRNDIPVDPTPYLRDVDDELEVTPAAARQIARSLPSPVSEYTDKDTSGISPFIAGNESFHPNIQYELTRRRVASETIHAYSPYVKLTSLMRVHSDNLSDNVTIAHFPSVGVHGEQEVSFDDIYMPRSGRSSIGYSVAEVDGKYVRTPVMVDDSADDPENIPMPGITDIKTEKGTAGPFGIRGGLFRANVQIIAYSVGQVDALLKYFLRPATRVILEIGKASTNPFEQVFPFNWNRHVLDIKNEIQDLILLKRSQRQFLETHVFNNFGRYDIYIGYVVKFTLKYTKDNLYIIDLIIHSVQQFEIPSKHTGIKSLCGDVDVCRATDIHEYFSPSSYYKQNTLSTLLGEVLSPHGILAPWRAHVVQFTNESKSTGKDSYSSNAANTDSVLWGKGTGGYFISWRFFVEVLLNNNRLGIMSVFPQDGGEASKLMGAGLIRPNTLVNPIQAARDNGVDPETAILSNEVGYHPALRSTDPAVMIIHNSAAQTRANAREQAILIEKSGSADIKNSAGEGVMTIGAGDFTAPPEGTPQGSSFLTNGVWINTNAIIRAFTGTDTVSSAIETLLVFMNGATDGYWNLQLLSDDTLSPGLHVVDYGLSKSKLQLNRRLADTPTQLLELTETNARAITPEMFASGKYTYVFNRKSKLTDDGDMGSETLDATVTFDLPQVIAVQAIAGIGGISEKSMLQSINIEELFDLSIIDLKAPECNDDPPRPCPGQPAIPKVGALTSVEDSTRKVQEYGSLGTTMKLVELDPSAMKNDLNKDSTESGAPKVEISPKTHAFNSSNLTKTVVDVTIPGIAGIQLWQSFLVDRVPSILQRGYYVVTKIEHSFSPTGGWTTKITGRFRFNPMEE